MFHCSTPRSSTAQQKRHTAPFHPPCAKSNKKGTLGISRAETLSCLKICSLAAAKKKTRQTVFSKIRHCFPENRSLIHSRIMSRSDGVVWSPNEFHTESQQTPSDIFAMVPAVLGAVSQRVCSAPPGPNQKCKKTSPREMLCPWRSCGAIP